MWVPGLSEPPTPGSRGAGCMQCNQPIEYFNQCNAYYFNVIIYLSIYELGARHRREFAPITAERIFVQRHGVKGAQKFRDQSSHTPCSGYLAFQPWMAARASWSSFGCTPSTRGSPEMFCTMLTGWPPASGPAAIRPAIEVEDAVKLV
eukprot:2518904-Prymnesium_polylepis.1